MSENTNKLKFKTGLNDGLPIGLGYLSISFAFGVQASMALVPPLMALLISMTNLTSAGQMAGLTIIAGCGTILEMILSQLVINARYFLMSINLAQKLDKSFNTLNRFLFSAFVTDEIFAVASSKTSDLNTKYFLGLVIFPYIGWSTGTILGALLGNVMPEIIVNALGIALYSMFIAIIIPPSIHSKGVLVAVILGAGTSAIMRYLLPMISSGIAIIICAILGAGITAFIFPVSQGKNEEEKMQDSKDFIDKIKEKSLAENSQSDSKENSEECYDNDSEDKKDNNKGGNPQ